MTSLSHVERKVTMALLVGACFLGGCIVGDPADDEDESAEEEVITSDVVPPDEHYDDGSAMFDVDQAFEDDAEPAGWDSPELDPDWNLPADDLEIIAAGLKACDYTRKDKNSGRTFFVRHPSGGRGFWTYPWWVQAVKEVVRHTKGFGASWHRNGQANFYALASIGCAESHYRLNAKNAWSHKGRHPYGIGQLLWYGKSTGQPVNSRACVEPRAVDRSVCRRSWLDRDNDVRAYWQMRAMMLYIKKRYGNPVRAWSFHRARSYY